MATPEDIRLQQIQTQFEADKGQASAVSGAINTGFKAVSAISSGVSNIQKQTAWNKQLFKGKEGLLAWAKEVGFPRPEVLASAASSGDKASIIKAYGMLDNWIKQQEKQKIAVAKQGTVEEKAAFSKRLVDIFQGKGSNQEKRKQIDIVHAEAGAKGIDLKGKVASIPTAFQDASLKQKEEFGKIQREGLDERKDQNKFNRSQAFSKNRVKVIDMLYGKGSEGRKDVAGARKIVNTFKKSIGKDGITGLGAFESFLSPKTLSLITNSLDKLGITGGDETPLGKYNRAFGENRSARDLFVVDFQKMISGVAVSEAEAIRIRGALQAAAGLDGVGFLIAVNKEIKALKEHMTGRISDAEFAFPDEVRHLRETGKLVTADEIPDFDVLISDLTGGHFDPTLSDSEAATAPALDAGLNTGGGDISDAELQQGIGDLFKGLGNGN